MEQKQPVQKEWTKEEEESAIERLTEILLMCFIDYQKNQEKDMIGGKS